MRIDSTCSKLLKTVGIKKCENGSKNKCSFLLAVRLDLTILRLKNYEKISIFDQNLSPKKLPYKKCENGSKNKCVL